MGNPMTAHLRKESTYYAAADGQLNGIPFPHVASVCSIMADRLEALSPSRLSSNDEGGVFRAHIHRLVAAGDQFAAFDQHLTEKHDEASALWVSTRKEWDKRRVDAQTVALSTKPEADDDDDVWPQWALDIRKKLMSFGVDPGEEEGWNIPEQFDDWIDEVVRLEREEAVKHTQPPTPAPESGEPVAYMAFDQNGCCELFIEEENAIEFASDGGSVGPLGILPSSNTDRHEHSYAEGWKQGLKEAEQIAVEMRKVHGSSTGDAYRCGAWDQGVRIAAAIRNTADSRNVAAPTPASGEQMKVASKHGHWFAVHSVTGMHIGLWQDGKTASEVRSEYFGGSITELVELALLTAANERAERAERECDRIRRERGLYCLSAQAAEALNTTLSEALERLENDGQEFLEAAEAVFDWMNGNDLSADHEEQKPDDFKRVSEALVAFRTALAALPAKQGGQS